MAKETRGIKASMIELTEAQVKKEVEDHLKLLMKSGRLWYVRLNAGVFGRHHN
ncbi:hypothetical protein LCGC14_2932580, partial [marine sediment metagenome]